MNYIKQLQRDIELANRENARVESELRGLMGYLHSSKFHVDTTVQTSDVNSRLMEILYP